MNDSDNTNTEQDNGINAAPADTEAGKADGLGEPEFDTDSTDTADNPAAPNTDGRGEPEFDDAAETPGSRPDSEADGLGEPDFDDDTITTNDAGFETTGLRDPLDATRSVPIV